MKNKSNKRCVDCNQILSRTAEKRCWPCHVKFCRGANHHCYRGGNPHCVDCGKELRLSTAIRCLDCYYKSIRKLPITYCCMDCGTRISKKSALYGLGRCRKCAKIGKNHSNYIDGRTKKEYFCKECHKQIDRSSALYRSQDELCKSCVRKGERSPWFGKSGKETNGYVHGLAYLPYSSEFNRTLKHQIRQRDNFICQKCGLKEEISKEKYGKTLCVHHIDYNKENCSEDNLVSLCVKCHSTTNGNRDYWFAYYTYVMENR